MQTLQTVAAKVAAVRAQVKSLREKATGAEAEKLDKVSERLDALVGTEEEEEEGAPRRGPHHGNFAAQRASLLQVLTMLQEVDLAPPTQVAELVPKLNQTTESLVQQWKDLESGDLAPLNLVGLKPQS